MATRRARRTDLREGAFDVDLLFSNAVVGSDGKIDLQASAVGSGQTWYKKVVAFTDLTAGQNSGEYSFTLPSEVAVEDANHDSDVSIKLYVNGLALSYSDEFTVASTTCSLTLAYDLDNQDTIELWYVEA